MSIVHVNNLTNGKQVRLINLTDKMIRNVRWLDLEPNASIGMSWADWLLMQSDEGVKTMLENDILGVESCD